jgi:hypothetical protein
VTRLIDSNLPIAVYYLLDKKMKTQKKQFDPLFMAADDWQFNSCLNYSHDPLEVYTIGYKEAADKLVNTLFEERLLLDALIYPICFLYRQYIELRLKEIIRSGRTLIEEGRGFPQHHKISALYQTAKGIIVKVFSEYSEAPDLLFVEHIISEYARIDPDSSSFRYPFDKSGANLLEGMTHINVRHLSENIKNFAEMMDNISCAISVYLDQKRELSDF